MATENFRRSKLGLEDPRVHKCTDRGNQFYEEDQQNSRRSRPKAQGGIRVGESWEHFISRIKDELEESTEQPKGGIRATFFLPRSKLPNILTFERVLAIIHGLSSSQRFSSHQKESLAQAICHGGKYGQRLMSPSLKLLAALLSSNAEKSFLELVNQGVNDACLPPAYENNDSTLRCQCPTRHKLLANEGKRKCRDFHTWAYALNAPYLKKPRQGKQLQRPHAHYVFTNNDVLPIISRREEDKHHSAEKTRQVTDIEPSESQGTHDGGFSTVTRVQFHPDHYDLGIHKGEKYKTFAMKQLTASDQESFSKEIASLLAFHDDGNQNLVKLLVTFEIKNHDDNRTQFYLIFPWADGNLWDFWRIRNAIDGRINIPQWMAEQCYLLSVALQSFHDQRSNQLPRIPSIRENEHDLYGRHGDIKAENILWFSKQNELVLNDFGLARLHTKISRSAQDPKGMSRTETYRAPEFDMPNGKISRASDIFSLGCAFLEFVTWYIEGYESVSKDFPDERMEPDPSASGFSTDTFFRIEDHFSGKVPVIKPKVKNWIERLRSNRKCTNYINDFLDLIESHMLDPSPKQRWDSHKVVRRLEVLSKVCRADTDYWKESIHRR